MEGWGGEGKELFRKRKEGEDVMVEMEGKGGMFYCLILWKLTINKSLLKRTPAKVTVCSESYEAWNTYSKNCMDLIIDVKERIQITVFMEYYLLISTCIQLLRKGLSRFNYLDIGTWKHSIRFVILTKNESLKILKIC